MTPEQIAQIRAAIVTIRDVLVVRVAQHPDAPAPVREALLDIVATLRAAERRCDLARDEMWKHRR